MDTATYPVALPPLSAMPPTMEPDDVHAYAVLGHLEAQERLDGMSDQHAKAYCAMRSRGAALDGIYHFWPLSRRAMRHLFASESTHESTGQALDRLQRPAALSVAQGTPDPESLVACKQQAERLSAALGRLSHAERALIEHLYGIELGTSEQMLHAVVAGVHRSTVSRRHRRVLSRLRSIIGHPSTPTSRR